MPQKASAGEPAYIQLVENQDGLTISLNAQASSQLRLALDEAGRRPDADLPMIRVGDVLLPGRLIPVVIDDAARADGAFAFAQALGIEAQLSAVDSEAWAGGVRLADVPVARTSDGEVLPDLTHAPDKTLPRAPITLLRESHMRGVHLAVLAATPIFERQGEARFARSFSVDIPDAKTLTDTTALLSTFATGADHSSLRPASASSAPLNYAAGGQTWKIKVANAGIQQVDATSLAGLALPVVANKLRVRYKGNEAALHVLDSNSNGWVDAGEGFRFYAAAPGDRWNATDTYWLTIENEASGSPARMNIQVTSGSSATPSTTAIEHGTYSDNKFYDAALNGLDGDHWFGAELNPFSTPAAWTITPTFVLPGVAGNVVVTVTGASSVNAAHTGRLVSSTVSDTKAWNGSGNFSLTFNLSSFNSPTSFQVLPTGSPERVKPDRVTWERPVSLNLSGKGTAFSIDNASSFYQVSGAPSNLNTYLYDVTNPLAPVIVVLNGDQFQHLGGSRDYVMSGNGALHTPQVTPNTPTNPTAKFNKLAIYIAPNVLGAGVLPLRDFMTNRGTPAEVFSVESLYDWWSYGQASPDAIRNFLRYAYQTWDVKPIAVTFVGDGTSDPLNYLGKISVNPNLIPPYLAHVDPNIASQPALGETACDACYVQLDGDDPLSDWAPDLLYGRLPVRSLTELNSLVSKIIGYETAPFDAASIGWRSRNVYLADNYLRPEAGGAPDPAGNFEIFSENSIAQQPASVQIKRMYYDPYALAPTASKEPNATNAYNRAKALFNEGAGLVNFVGHANIIQLAVTDASAQSPNPRYLLFLLDPDGMTNAGKLPIVLQMTCLTSAFQTPIEYYGTTIDERLVLSQNGAIAVWGSSGQGVSYGHDALQRGFYKALWSSTRMQTPVGALAQGGYLELFAGGAALDSMRTFILLGDPLTRARVGPATNYLPLLAK